MRSGTQWLIALVLISGLCMGDLPAQSTGEAADRSRSPEEQLTNVFERYNQQRIGLNEVYEQLKSWDQSTLTTAAEELLSSDYETLKNVLSPEHLRSEVRSSLRSTLREKRRRLLKIIRNKNRYRSAGNRSLKKKVAAASVGLFTLFRKPLVYHLQTNAETPDVFFRAVALIRFFRSANRTVPGPGEKLLKRLGSAKEIISTATVGRAVELQPHSRENKNIEKKNRNTKVTLSEKERELIQLVNTYREAFGLRKLLIHEDITSAARRQSKEMKKIGKLTHVTGETSRKPLLSRLSKNGFSARVAGENVARGEDPPIAVLKGWIQSPEHHRNLLKKNYRYLGLAKVGAFWTLDMATVPRVQDQGSSFK